MRTLFTLPAGRRSRWITLALWVIAMAVAIPLASTMDSVQSDKVTDRLPADAELTRVVEIAEDTLSAIRTVAAGDALLSPGATRSVIARVLAAPDPAGPPPESLDALWCC